MLLAKARVAKALPAPATDKRELQEEGGYTPNTKELRFFNKTKKDDDRCGCRMGVVSSYVYHPAVRWCLLETILGSGKKV